MLRDDYADALQEMMENGFIEDVVEEANSVNHVFYLPHQPHVRMESQSTKLRPVFNASA